MTVLPDTPPISKLLRDFFERKAKMVAHQQMLPKREAEREALKITVALARNRGDTWADLREAIAEYPELRSLVPYIEGKVHMLPATALRASPCALRALW